VPLRCFLNISFVNRSDFKAEFDKRTSLGVKQVFPKLMYTAHFISESVSKDICAQLSREVINLVPQVVDYSCTICESRLHHATQLTAIAPTARRNDGKRASES